MFTLARLFLSILLSVVLLSSILFGTSVDAQDAGNSSVLAEVISEAAENGVGVVVVDSSGQLLSLPEEGAGEAESTNMMDSPSSLMKVQSEVDAFREEFNSRLEALPYSIFEVQYILQQTSPDGRIVTYVEILGWSILFLLIGRWLSVEIYGKRIAKQYVVARIKEQPDGYAEKVPFLVYRFFMGVGATIFAMVFALSVGRIVFGPAEDSSIAFTVTAIFAAYFLASTASDLWRMVLSPYLSQYRVPVLSDRDAKRLYLWAAFLATYDICAVLFTTWVGDFGLNYNVYALVYGVTALVGACGNVLMVLVNARAISGAIRAGRHKEECSWLIRVLAVAWAPVVVAYMVFGWLELVFDLVLEHNVSVPLMAGTYLVLTSILVVYGVMNYAIERMSKKRRFHAADLEEIAESDVEGLETGEDSVSGQVLEETPAVPVRHPISSYEDLARRVAGILAFMVGIFALLFVWNPDAEWMESTAVESGIDVIAVLFIGYIVYHFFRIWIDSKIDEETGDLPEAELGDEGGAGGASRLATLLPLFRGAILAVVIVSIVLIALLELGINVSPLFAGAGVVGLAVGFGSQTLVRDIFSGAFFLVDDAFRKGEYIDIGDVKGTVEKISVRSFQLRHHLGALHTIPFGEIKVLTNYSRDWVMMKLPLRVTYDTDVERVRKLIKTLGKELLKDPVIGDNFIQPLKSQGVIEMQDSAMIIRVKFMTKPGDQWLVRKKVFQEIRELFTREGIKFAHREVTVRLAPDQEGEVSPKKKEAAVGAVQAAIDEDFLDDMHGDGD
ncbi:mechanosensitive ion channel family protein [Epibacterium ulvae]|uniref:mechanosensitive ion channel family protein n=1 Tax=Epibacterium ulvae TaxID=1156985 RepID=UPI0024900A2E|nr:mechanosensitive ion channel family protein [Epibacterium ulvae]